MDWVIFKIREREINTTQEIHEVECMRMWECVVRSNLKFRKITINWLADDLEPFQRFIETSFHELIFWRKVIHLFKVKQNQTKQIDCLRTIVNSLMANRTIHFDTKEKTTHTHRNSKYLGRDPFFCWYGVDTCVWFPKIYFKNWRKMKIETKN